MLVVGRNRSESTVIDAGSSTVVTLIHLGKRYVLLGGQAPEDCSSIRSDPHEPPSSDDDLESSGSGVPRPGGGNLPTLSVVMQSPPLEKDGA